MEIWWRFGGGVDEANDYLVVGTIAFCGLKWYYTEKTKGGELLDSIISKILEIDARACEIVREAEERKLDIAGIIEDEKEAFHASEIEQAEKKLEAERVKIISAADKEAKEHIARSEEKIALMEKYRGEHFDTWVEELYGRIVK